MHIHVIQQEEYIHGGAFIAWAKNRGATITYTRCYLGENFDRIDTLPDLLIVLGGPQNPKTSLKECPYFNAVQQRSFISQCILSNIAIIGSCLGAQLVGEACGAEYEKSPECEIGGFDITKTAEGEEDPLLGHIPSVFAATHWHNDMPGLTSNAVVLAQSAGCPRQIVKYRPRVYALQCHMEFTRDIVKNLIKHEGASLKKEGTFIQNEQELLSFDFDTMNQYLYGFLDKLMEQQ